MRMTMNSIRICLATIALISGLSATSAVAATAMNGQLVVRSLTPQDLIDYSLTNVQKASGLLNVGIGQPPGSLAVLTNSPLGPGVPIDRPSERLVSQVAARKLLRPDVAGQYTVKATIVTTTSGTTNLFVTVTAGTYMGINTCALCHSGGQIAPNKVVPWEGTLHATRFTRGINGETGTNYSAADIPFHTVGYDTNSSAD